MIDDVRRRLPYYISDWTDAWDYRVVPATVYMYFAKYVLPMEGTQRADEAEEGGRRARENGESGAR